MSAGLGFSLARMASAMAARHLRNLVLAGAPDLSPEERAEVKKAARELLAKLKALLVINWRQKSSARSQVKLAIEDVLDAGLPRAYAPEVYLQKCSAVFEHVFENYTDAAVGTYAAA